MMRKDFSKQEALYVVRSSTAQSPHYIRGGEGADGTMKTYDRAEAGSFTKSQAELLAHDWTEYAVTKGYGYTYRIEQADLTVDNEASGPRNSP